MALKELMCPTITPYEQRLLSPSANSSEAEHSDNDTWSRPLLGGWWHLSATDKAPLSAGSFPASHLFWSCCLFCIRHMQFVHILNILVVTAGTLHMSALVALVPASDPNADFPFIFRVSSPGILNRFLRNQEYLHCTVFNRVQYKDLYSIVFSDICNTPAQEMENPSMCGIKPIYFHLPRLNQGASPQSTSCTDICFTFDMSFISLTKLVTPC